MSTSYRLTQHSITCPGSILVLPRFRTSVPSTSHTSNERVEQHTRLHFHLTLMQSSCSPVREVPCLTADVYRLVLGCLLVLCPWCQPLSMSQANLDPHTQLSIYRGQSRLTCHSQPEDGSRPGSSASDSAYKSGAPRRVVNDSSSGALFPPLIRVASLKHLS